MCGGEGAGTKACGKACIPIVIVCSEPSRCMACSIAHHWRM